MILPLAGIQILRLYESALVRQTESQLLAQGAFVTAVYRQLLQDVAVKPLEPTDELLAVSYTHLTLPTKA